MRERVCEGHIGATYRLLRSRYVHFKIRHSREVHVVVK